MNLFDPDAVDPANLEPWSGAEPLSYYYQTSGRTPIRRMRDLLEEWFEAYPDEHKFELAQRIRTAERDFDSPFFELFLHALMVKLGAAVEVHPKVSDDTERRPDFLVRLMNGFSFYLEARRATGVSVEERSRDNMVTDLARYVNERFREQRFFVAVRIVSIGKGQPSATKIENELNTYLTGLDGDEVGRALIQHGFSTEFHFIWQRDGCEIIFIPVPRKQSAIGKPFRPMASRLGLAKWSTTKADIRAAVEYKCKHHNSLPLPYVVAVNATEWTADEEDFQEALYGSMAFACRVTATWPGEFSPTILRDGIWLSDAGPRNENLIAVLGVEGLNSSGVASRIAWMYENPVIEYPEQAVLPHLPRVTRDGNGLREATGAPLSTIFSLPDDWPRIGKDYGSPEREYRMESGEKHSSDETRNCDPGEK